MLGVVVEFDVSEEFGPSVIGVDKLTILEQLTFNCADD